MVAVAEAVVAVVAIVVAAGTATVTAVAAMVTDCLANILGFFGGKKNIKFSLPLPPMKHDTH